MAKIVEFEWDTAIAFYDFGHKLFAVRCKHTAILLYIDKLKEYGFNINKNFTVTAIKPIREQVYELRPSSTRVFFFYYKEGVFVLLHAYEKKTNTTDPKEIDKAIKEKNNLIKRK